jgi:ribonucleoside-diphosphate reductase alpha chain
VSQEVLKAQVGRIRGGCSKICVTTSSIGKNGKFHDVFINLGKGGGCANAWAESVARLASQILQLGGDMQEHIINQLEDIRCPETIITEQGTVKSCSDGIAKVLKHISKSQSKKKVDKSHMINRDMCTECGGKLRREGGCFYCEECGSSKCG